MIAVEFSSLEDFKAELLCRRAQVRDKCVRIQLRRKRELVPDSKEINRVTSLWIRATAALDHPAGEADVLCFKREIATYFGDSQANEELAEKWEQIWTRDFEREGFTVRDGEYVIHDAPLAGAAPS